MKVNIEKKTWSDFRKTGLLLILNQFLHIFGWTIVYEFNEGSSQVKEVYHARTKFRGYNEHLQGKAYKTLTEYLKANAEELNNDIKEDNDEQ